MMDQFIHCQERKDLNLDKNPFEGTMNECNLGIDNNNEHESSPLGPSNAFHLSNLQSSTELCNESSDESVAEQAVENNMATIPQTSCLVQDDFDLRATVPLTSSNPNNFRRKTLMKQIDFLKDDPSEMTWGRRLALYWMKYSWYYPGKSNPTPEEDEQATADAVLDVSASRGGACDAYPFVRAKRGNPSLARAWAYFEHVTLPRYVVDEGENNGHNLQEDQDTCDRPRRETKNTASYKKAQPGENLLPTKLYPPLSLPHKELGDFSMGTGLYLTALLTVAFVTFIGGLISIPIIMYYASDKYSSDKQANVSWWLRGSAICTDVSWVPCNNCSPGDFPLYRIANATNSFTGQTTIFALRNNCNGATLQNGIVSLAVLIVVVLGTLTMHFWMVRAEIEFDENEQTAQDYSIVIRNPPHDAHDPNEWKDFFCNNFEGAHVSVCTIGVDNDFLVRALVTRRENLRLIEMKVEPGTSLDTMTIAGIAAKEERNRGLFGKLKALVLPGIPEHFAKVVVSTARIQGLAQLKYPVSNVFITFETEAAQRRVLEAFSVGKYASTYNVTSPVKDPKHLFRGNIVLRVTEPEEPNTVRWADLNAKWNDRMKQQCLTILATAVAITFIAFIVKTCYNASVLVSAVVIASSNVLFPIFAKLLTSTEKHPSESGLQKSLYLKVALFRWVNTAVVITVILPFTSTLQQDQGLVQQIFALFFAEIVTMNLIQLTDIPGHICRHLIAPRSKNQDAMNLCMQGREVDLAERYTDMTKVFLLAVWYCSIFPTTLFLCSLALVIHYYTDRFCVMRSWKRSPNLGSSMSAFSRTYFFPVALVAMAILSSYFWAGFPYDNLCEGNVGNSSGINSNFTGTWLVDPSGSQISSVVDVSETDPSYIFCRQDFFRYYKDAAHKFPFISQNQLEGLEWMTTEQATVSDIWGWTTVVVIILILLKFFIGWIQNFMDYCFGDYKACGEDQNKPFSLEDSITTYIPQVKSMFYPYPLLACNIDDIDNTLMDWTDPDRPHSFYDLTRDAEILLRATDINSSHTVFSRIAHWPPSCDHDVRLRD